MRWKVVKSEYLFHETWFTVRADTCERPDGKIVSPYYVFEFPTWVTAFPITGDGKVILEKQYRHAIGEVNFEIPGGCVDATDKSLEEAIRRELLEETGYSFSQLEYLGKTCANPSTNTNWMHMFLARGGVPAQKQSLDENEDIELHFATIAEVKQLLRDNQIIQSMHVTAMLYALTRLGELKY